MVNNKETILSPKKTIDLIDRWLKNKREGRDNSFGNNILEDMLLNQRNDLLLKILKEK